LLGIEYYVDHGAEFGRQHVIRRIECDSLLQPLLESVFRSICRQRICFEFSQCKKNQQSIAPLNAGFDHVTGHEFQSLFQVAGKLGIWPMQIVNE
jgi:hypothetical protein